MSQIEKIKKRIFRYNGSKTVLWLLLSIISLNSVASSIEGLRRQEEKSRLQLKKLEKRKDILKADKKKKEITIPTETPCFIIQEIELRGAKANKFKWLLKDVNPYLCKCIGIRGIMEIIRMLNTKLIETGYITTKVALPRQNLKKGTLKLSFFLGKIEEVKQVVIRSNKKLKKKNWGIWQNAFPVRKGDILNLRAFEHGVENMKRLPSKGTVSTKIEPGEKPDTSIVNIVEAPVSFLDRLYGGTTIDNSGSKDIGKAGLSGYVGFDNPLGLNDTLVVSGNTNLKKLGKNHHSQSGSVIYSIPYGYALFSVSRSHNRNAHMIYGDDVSILSSGYSDSSEYKARYTLYRSSSLKFGLYSKMNLRKAKSFLRGTELLNQRAETTFIEHGLNVKKRYLKTKFDFMLGYKYGVKWLSDRSYKQDVNLRPKIWKISGDFNLNFNKFQYKINLTGQYTNDQTLSVEHISIGNRHSVRGFDEESNLLGESGYYIRQEVFYSFNIFSTFMSFPYFGFDVGHVFGKSTDEIGRSLVGIAFGLRSYFRGFNFDITMGIPVYKPEHFKSSRVNMYFSLGFGF